MSRWLSHISEVVILLICYVLTIDVRNTVTRLTLLLSLRQQQRLLHLLKQSLLLWHVSLQYHYILPLDCLASLSHLNLTVLHQTLVLIQQ